MKRRMTMKIFVTAGGSMGHINPALAIIDEFKKREKNVEVFYFGTHNRMEKDLIPKLGYTYIPLEVYGFSKNILLDMKNIRLVKKAITVCREWIKKEHPDIVIGVGGYVTYPVVVAAHKEHIPIFIHEQNSIPGKSNKMVSRYADLIGVTFESSKKYFKTKGKIIYTGHPCGAWALKTPKKKKQELGLDPAKRLVTVVAGSQGSGSLNDKMKDYLMSLKRKNYEICYITGKYHYDEYRQNKFPKNVHLFPYMDELPGLLKISDIVLSRAGAGSLFEILALKVPSIIIPSPNVANNHQYYNALELAKKDCIYLLEESTITTAKITESIENLLNNEELRLKLKVNMDKEDVQESASIIYEKIKELIS